MALYLSDNIINCLTLESKRNLKTIDDPSIIMLSDNYLNSKNIKTGIEKCKEMLQPYLHTLLQTIKIKPQIKKIETKIYDPNEFLHSKHNKITNIQKDTYAYNKFKILNTLDIYEITFFNNLCFKLYVYYDKENLEIFNIIQTIINRLHLIVSTFATTNNMKYLTKIFTSNNPIPLHIYLYPFNRNIGYNIDNNETLEYYNHNNCCHCSSGYSNSSYAKVKVRDNYANSNGDDNVFEVVCTRIPEILGLFTHEMFHILHCDTRYYTTNVDNNNIFELNSNQLDENSDALISIIKNYNRKVKDYKFLETFNNTTTTILHSFYCAIELLVDTQNLIIDDIKINNIMQLFGSILKKEIIYSIYHTAKILHNQHINFAKEYFTNESNTKSYHQLAYLYEYTIVRSFMFMELDNYVKYMLFKDFGFFDGNDSTQVDILTKMVAKLLENVFEMMYNKKSIEKILYNKIFDNFVKILIEDEKLYLNNKNDSCDVCGPVNMEYFCIDHNYCMMQLLVNIMSEQGQEQRQIEFYYYKKYLKYKTKYYNCKHTIRNP